MGMLKPALIHSKFFPALQGHKTKMSGSVGNTTIMVTDSKKEVLWRAGECESTITNAD